MIETRIEKFLDMRARGFLQTGLMHTLMVIIDYYGVAHATTNEFAVLVGANKRMRSCVMRDSLICDIMNSTTINI